DGSMRDALSLLDQAISFGDGKLTDAEVLTMLGSIDRQEIAAILQAVVAGDAPGVMQGIAAMDEHAPDYEAALGDIASLLQRAALAQLVPDAIDDSHGDRELAMALAGVASADELQLYYQIALIGRRDLYLAANPRGGFEMVLLRMLAFRPAGPGDSAGTDAPVRKAAAKPKAASTTAQKKPPVPTAAPQTTTKPDPQPAQVQKPKPAIATDGQVDWAGIIEQVNLRGAARELAANCEFSRRKGHVWHLTLDERHAHLLTDQQRDRLGAALSEVTGAEVSLRIKLGKPAAATPAEKKVQAAEDELDAARDNIASDPNVKALKDLFGASVVEDSVRPTDNGENGA
ncbi:MAG: DNA polymerase III subunit gamma/tau, partial [Gammaproteobacteria bacterium]|nr:DNA polymerase III subunit gamma/tau [Gammaproteobacteria bacterium]